MLFRDAAAIERLRTVDTLIVDKTGTLTEGKPAFDRAVPVDGVASRRGAAPGGQPGPGQRASAGGRHRARRARARSRARQARDVRVELGHRRARPGSGPRARARQHGADAPARRRGGQPDFPGGGAARRGRERDAPGGRRPLDGSSGRVGPDQGQHCRSAGDAEGAPACAS